MAITAGQDTLAADFINESERNATPANDAGRVVKLESDGYISPAFIKDVSCRLKTASDFTLGIGNLDIPIEWDTETFDDSGMHTTSNSNLYNDTTQNVDETMGATTDWVGQEFTTGAGDPVLLGDVLFYMQHTVVDSHTYEVVLRSSLTGADIATSGVKTFSPPNTTFQAVTAQMGSAVLQPSTTYYIVVKTTTYPASGTLNFAGNSAGSGGWRTDDSGASWSAATNADGYKMTVATNNAPAITVPSAGLYLIILNLDSGNPITKTAKIFINNTVYLERIFHSDSTVESGGTIQTLASLSADDVVLASLRLATSAADDVLAEGSSLEIIRIR